MRSQLAELVRQFASPGRAQDMPFASEARAQVTATLLSILGCKTTPVAAFVAACQCFRTLTSGGIAWSELVIELDALIAAFDRQITHPGLRALLSLNASGGADAAVSYDVAKYWKMNGRDMSRVVAVELGIGVPRLRIALRCRPTITQLLATDARIAQVAYGCGYQHASQLDHDFGRLFGISPRAFRNLASSSLRTSQPRVDQGVNKTVNESVK